MTGDSKAAPAVEGAVLCAAALADVELLQGVDGGSIFVVPYWLHFRLVRLPATHAKRKATNAQENDRRIKRVKWPK